METILSGLCVVYVEADHWSYLHTPEVLNQSLSISVHWLLKIEAKILIRSI